MNTAWCANTLWMWSCRREWRAFRRAARDPAQAQADLLRQMLTANAGTWFGWQYEFRDIDSPREYQRRVPVTDYEALAPLIERAAAGEANVLSAEPVPLFEPTSGSSSARKLIPYTASLQRQYQRMIAAWIYDLFRNRPAVRRGRAYWSISPALGPPQRTSGGIAIGFDTDADYLGGLGRRLIGRLLAVPADVARQPDIDEFRFATLSWLLRADDLALISVWSPTFLTALLSKLDDWTDRLCAELCGQAPRRARVVGAILNSSAALEGKLRRLWPRLALISCWADAASRVYVPQVQELFPTVEIQPKGLLATEGCVSFPLVGRCGAALALRSHFFEFEELVSGATSSTTGDCRLAHELEPGGRYGVVLTTGGGLYRYRLHDVVEVVGWEDRCPLLVFHGRANSTADLVGEKLAEPHVRAVLDRAFDRFQLTPAFALVALVSGTPPRYRLYIQPGSAQSSSLSTEQLGRALQAALEENPYYRYACRLRQLDPIDVRLLDASGPPGWRLFERRRIAQVLRAGDIKPTVLDPQTGWDDVFAPYVVESAGRTAEAASGAA
jgi:hypothetical protein